MKFLILFLLIVFSSCQNDEKQKMINLIKEWNGREILFPHSPIFTIQGEDTVDFFFRNAEYKMVSYFDPLRCISCKLQLR